MPLSWPVIIFARYTTCDSSAKCLTVNYQLEGKFLNLRVVAAHHSPKQPKGGLGCDLEALYIIYNNIHEQSESENSRWFRGVFVENALLDIPYLKKI